MFHSPTTDIIHQAILLFDHSPHSMPPMLHSGATYSAVLSPVSKKCFLFNLGNSQNHQMKNTYTMCQ